MIRYASIRMDYLQCCEYSDDIYELAKVASSTAFRDYEKIKSSNTKIFYLP